MFGFETSSRQNKILFLYFIKVAWYASLVKKYPGGATNIKIRRKLIIVKISKRKNRRNLINQLYFWENQAERG